MKMRKVEEVPHVLENEHLKHDLMNIIRVFDKIGKKDDIMKCMTQLPKFEDIVKVTLNLLIIKFQEMAE